MVIIMRIGNIEDTEKEKTQEADNLANLIKSDPEAGMTKPEKMKNWWYYRKWYVMGGAVAIVCAFHIIGTFLGWWTKEPDFQIAYISDYALPDEAISAIEKEFAAIAEDYNGDGEVVVQVNQYSYTTQNSNNIPVIHEYGNEVPLVGDISARVSFFFITDDPDGLQQKFQILADSEGNCPAEEDYSAEGRVIAWADCPLLSEMELGEFDASYGFGEPVMVKTQDMLSKCYIGRRCFYDERVSVNYEHCCELWEIIRSSK